MAAKRPQHATPLGHPQDEGRRHCHALALRILVRVPYHLESRDPPSVPAYVMPVPVDELGLQGPTKSRAAGPGWRRSSPGLYVPSHVDAGQPAQRVVEAAGRLTRSGALTGWAVMLLHGCRYFDGSTATGRLPVRLLIGPHQGRRARTGIQWCYDRLPSRVEVLGLPCVPPLWAVFDEMRRGDLPHAVVTADMALRAGFVTLPELTDFVAERVGVSGVPVVREALELADQHSGSPPETRVRLLWVCELGLPRPLCNVAVFDGSGRLLGYPDLLDAESGLAVEYDGEDHRDARRHSDDVVREAAFRDAGLEMARVTGRDLRHPAALGRRLLMARARAQQVPQSARTWSLEP